MITVNPHEGRFDNFNRLPRINSKYKNSFKLEMNKTLGRNYSPKKYDYLITNQDPSHPSNTTFYNEGIPKYFPG